MGLAPVFVMKSLFDKSIDVNFDENKRFKVYLPNEMRKPCNLNNIKVNTFQLWDLL